MSFVKKRVEVVDVGCSRLLPPNGSNESQRGNFVLIVNGFEGHRGKHIEQQYLNAGNKPFQSRVDHFTLCT